MVTGPGSRGKTGPSHRGLGGIRGRQGLKTAFFRQAREIGHETFLHPAARQSWVHTIKAKDNRPAVDFFGVCPGFVFKCQPCQAPECDQKQ